MPSTISRVVALCYIRQSYTRDENDTSSPKRQRDNIAAYCQRMGWQPEWYEDAEGHKSGRRVDNRPAWLALEKRLTSPEVVAIVANDLSRLHRKTWRVGQLMDRLDDLCVHLVLAEPGREIDTSTPMGRMLITILAMQDEAYANDISVRAKASIRHRKKQGKTVGIPPFGTERDADGFLVRSNKGAWLLPDGRFQAGRAGQKPPVSGALWREYHAAAEYVLVLYTQGNLGLERIAYQVNEEGWPFRDRNDNPRAFTRGDVRRIVSNWQEYGGLIVDQRAKDRPGYAAQNVEDIILNPARAVFDVDLLKKVAVMRGQRSRKPVDHGKNLRARIFPLSVISRCAHCEQNAEKEGDPSLKTSLTGHGKQDGTRRYEHRRGVQCGITNRSITAEELEGDFERLIKTLSVKPEAFDLLTELSLQIQSVDTLADAEFEARKQEAVALCRRKIDAAVNLYGDGRIDRAEYLRRVDANEREIAHWEARTTDVQQAALELRMCIDLVNQIGAVWTTSDYNDQQQLVRMLFDELIVDLDMRRIVDFKLKPWADRFLVARAELMVEQKSRSGEQLQGEVDQMPPRRFELLFWP